VNIFKSTSSSRIGVLV